MMSSTSRAHRRGGISLGEFVNLMRRAGFVEHGSDKPRVMTAFRHPATGEYVYDVPFGESFAAAVTRIQSEKARRT